MSEAEKKLEAHKFVRTHKGYLVNMNYVYRLREKELLLLNGKSIPVSRNYLNQVRMKIMGVVMAVSYTHLRAHETRHDLVVDLATIFIVPVSYTHLTLPTKA